MTTVESILLADGPALSSDIARKLVAQGCSADVARQRISRAGPHVRRLKGLVFPRNARFLYHEKHEGTERYWTALARDIREASPAYGPALAALQARDGVVPLEQFAIISGSPIRQQGHVSSETVLQRLEAVHLVERGELQGVGPVVALRADGHLGSPNFQRLRARLVVEKMLLLALRDWARRLGVASYDKIEIRGETDRLPTFGTFNWDLCGPSYLVPIVRRERDGRPKPGFLVGDVIAGAAVDEHAVAAFIRKFSLSSYLKNLPPFMPVLVADGYTQAAFNLGRTHGIMLATPKNLFGRDLAIGLATLLETLSKAAAVAVAKPEVIGELFDKLSSIEGADRNLRGSLFELVVGHVVQARFGGSIDINHLLRYDTFKAELDVRRVVAGEVWIYECKGYQPDHLIDAPEVETWLTEKVPGIYRTTKAEDRFNSSTVHFEFWTSGGFTDAAIAALEAARDRTKRYVIGWKDGREVRSELAKLSSSGMTAMFDQHFLKHPIAVFDRRHDGAGALANLHIDPTIPVDPTVPFVPALPKPASRQDIRAGVEAAMAYERSAPTTAAAE
ncbi:MAG: hypothetical protein J0I21_16130 [Alphaproteobacteria bacterium]|nr:hypothetical protein [Alphaproteobacteria bacterium]